MRKSKREIAREQVRKRNNKHIGKREKKLCSEEVDNENDCKLVI